MLTINLLNPTFPSLLQAAQYWIFYIKAVISPAKLTKWKTVTGVYLGILGWWSWVYSFSLSLLEIRIDRIKH